MPQTLPTLPTRPLPRSTDPPRGVIARAQLRRGIKSVGLAAVALLGLLSCSESPTEPSESGLLETGRIEHWTTAPPASRGISGDVLREMEGQISGGEFGEISSLLIARGGELVYERYWGDWGPQDLHAVNSVSKSVTSLLVGIAHGTGEVGTLDTPVLDLLPELSPLANPEGKDGITLRHVLTMRTGLEWDELSTDYRQAANPVVALATSPNWLQFVMDLPFVDSPGTAWVYNSGVSMLMAGVLDHTLQRSAEDFAAEHLFARIGITDWSWSSGPHGLTNSGWGLQLRPRDMATIGQMVLQAGLWNGTQVVPTAWIEESAERATRFIDGTGYGYQWWLPRDDGGPTPMAAWGYGGQFIVVIPSLELLVVSTAENFEGGGFSPYTLADWLYRAVEVGSAG